MQSFYWASNIKDLCRRTAIGDLGAAHTLAGRLSDKGFNTELIVTNLRSTNLIGRWSLMRIMHSLGPTRS